MLAAGSGAVRVVRALAFVAAVVLVTTVGHEWAGGSTTPVGVAAPAAASWPVALLGTGRRRGFRHAVGHRLDTGAPLTGTEPNDAPDLHAVDRLGFPVIDAASHMRRAMPVEPHERILRRPYAYDDAPAPGTRTNTGLVFVSFQADPVRQFVPIQRRLDEADLLSLWTTPIGSGVYAVLPGAREGEHLGAALLA